MLSEAIQLPRVVALQCATYVRHPSDQTNPLYPVTFLRALANRTPTTFLSKTAHKQINFFGDLISWNHKLHDEWELKRWRDEKSKELLQAMHEAETLRDYEAFAHELDDLQGNDAWKESKESVESTYDPDTIFRHMEEMQEATTARDPDLIVRLLRTKLSRDLGGMSNLRLYKHSWIGTKRLIDDYIQSILTAIETFLDVTAAANLSTDEANKYLSALEEALKFFGRSALTLSGGATLGMKHIGAIKALFESDLLPKIIAGTSAGSIVAAIAGQATDDEMTDILEKFPASDLKVFDPPGEGVFLWIIRRLVTFCKERVFFDISNLEKVMKSWLGDITFLEAYNKTGRTLSITVSSAERSQAQILNHITAPHVYLWSAVCASCAVPLVFRPQSIYMKDPKTKSSLVWTTDSQAMFMDGSLDHDIPARKLSEMCNVNYFMVSQINPHVRLFLGREESFTGIQPPAVVPKPCFIRRCMIFTQGEIIHRAQQAADLGLPRFVYRWASILNQQYTGDLNILPEIHLRECSSMMSNPTPEFMRQATTEGEKAIFPKMSRIRNSVSIELALVRAIRELRDLANFNPEARAARRRTREALRSRSRDGGSHMRNRSLSNPRNSEMNAIFLTSGPPSPHPLATMRKSASSVSLLEKLGITPMKGGLTTLSPQGGLNEQVNPFEDALRVEPYSYDESGECSLKVPPR